MSWTWRYFGGDFPNKHKGISLNTDFRVWLLYERYMRNTDIIDSVKAASSAKHCLANYEEDWTTTTLVDCLSAMQWFYNCGNDITQSGITKEEAEQVIEGLKSLQDDDEETSDTYSYYHDSRHIWGAFMSAYNIDLFKENLHWWKFRTLFENLPETNSFGNLKRIRTLKKSDVVTASNKDKGRAKQVREWNKIELQQVLIKLPEY